jgi:hypothetical protein
MRRGEKKGGFVSQRKCLIFEKMWYDKILFWVIARG